MISILWNVFTEILSNLICLHMCSDMYCPYMYLQELMHSGLETFLISLKMQTGARLHKLH